MKTLVTLGIAAAGALGLTPGLGAFHMSLISESAYVPPKQCIEWYDGCNMCLREDNGTVMCSQRSCADDGAGFCRLYDTAASSSAH